MLLDLLTAEEAARLRKLGQRVSFSDGQIIHDRGDGGADMVIVIQGAVTLSRLHSDGKTAFSSAVRPGQNYADSISLCGKARIHRAVAVGETVVDLYSRSKVEHILNSEITIVRALYRIASHRLVTTMDSLDDARLFSSEVRIAKMLLRMAGTVAASQTVECRREDLAQIVGLSSVTVIQTLQQLASLGLVRLGYRHIHVPDVPGMERWVQARCDD